MLVKNKTQLLELVLPVNFLVQGERSVNCGPCSVKMMLDYHQLMNPKTGQSYSLQSLNRLLRVSRDYGCQESNILSFFKEKKISYKDLSFKQIIPSLRAGKPVLTSFKDELFDGHYALIIGHDSLEEENFSFIFHDPWPDFGPHFKRYQKDFRLQVRSFGNWLISLDI